MSQVSPTLPTPLLVPLVSPAEWEAPTFASPPIEIGGCGLPLEPLDPATLHQWQAEVEAVVATPMTGGAVQAELSGFEDDEDLGESVPESDDDDEFDDFDDIDEDDFDDDFDDDFEEELDDDYEIEIEDEISAEFGLSGVVGVDIDDIDSVDDLDADIEIDPDDVEEKE